MDILRKGNLRDRGLRGNAASEEGTGKVVITHMASEVQLLGYYL